MTNTKFFNQISGLVFMTILDLNLLDPLKWHMESIQKNLEIRSSMDDFSEGRFW